MPPAEKFELQKRQWTTLDKARRDAALMKNRVAARHRRERTGSKDVGGGSGHSGNAVGAALSRASGSPMAGGSPTHPAGDSARPDAQRRYSW